MSTPSKNVTSTLVSESDVLDLCGLNDLGEHMSQCRPAHRSIHRARGVFEAMNQFVMPRVVSSVAGVGTSAAIVLYFMS